MKELSQLYESTELCICMLLIINSLSNYLPSTTLHGAI
jgi:hypothetical protein